MSSDRCRSFVQATSFLRDMTSAPVMSLGLLNIPMARTYRPSAIPVWQGCRLTSRGSQRTHGSRRGSRATCWQGLTPPASEDLKVQQRDRAAARRSRYCRCGANVEADRRSMSTFPSGNCRRGFSCAATSALEGAVRNHFKHSVASWSIARATSWTFWRLSRRLQDRSVARVRVGVLCPIKIFDAV